MAEGTPREQRIERRAIRRIKLNLAAPEPPDLVRHEPCPGCNRFGTLRFTGGHDRFGNRVYYCRFCLNQVGMPTDHFFCDRFQKFLEKDSYFSPCNKCPYRVAIPEHLWPARQDVESGTCTHMHRLPFTEVG